jgi:streptogramin lyase
MAGDGPGEFNEPSSISVAPNGDIYVADFWNQRIQHFNAEFEYVDEISVDSWGSQGITDRAYIVALPDGRVLATDPANGRIVVFDPSGEEEAAWRLPSDTGMTRPVGITVDAEGQVYVADGLTSQVVRLPLTALLTPPSP